MRYPQRSSTLVLGIGNILLRDEGVGVRVVEALQRMELPGDVEVLDGGTASMALLDTFTNRGKVIVIDAVRGNNAAGTLYRLTPTDIAALGGAQTSVHQLGLLDALIHMECLGDAPREVIIYGVEPKEMEWGMDLTPEVEAVIPRLVELVLAELATPTNRAVAANNDARRGSGSNVQLGT
ncbi:MAG: HyaD/HybD family hydrogenase maturation endopeptidase [Dehalococcoidia bacterium]|nr:HyaD/HybD family hydrogenase maturation endopeptidase [Dehalococcoidia bacterium]